MSTKHIATLPDGTIVKRTSAGRVYPYTVAVSPMPRAELVEILERRIAASVEYNADYAEVLNYARMGGELVEVGNSIFATNLAPKRHADRQAQARGQRNVGWTFGRNEGRDFAEIVLEQYADHLVRGERCLAKEELELEAAITGPALVGPWFVTGWQSRNDLALKESDRARGCYRNREVRIVETEHTTK